jgi:hypothetical protein
MNWWRVNAFIWASCLAVWGFLFSVTLTGEALLMTIISGAMLAYCIWRDTI